VTVDNVDNDHDDPGLWKSIKASYVEPRSTMEKIRREPEETVSIVTVGRLLMA
jgi:hypothetical protein